CTRGCPRLWRACTRTSLRYRDFGRLATHLRFLERQSRKLARESFHAMAVYRAGLERRQGFLFRWVDAAMELYAMAASVSHARRLRELGRPEGPRAEELADLFCRMARRKVMALVGDLWRNDDRRKRRLAEGVAA